MAFMIRGYDYIFGCLLQTKTSCLIVRKVDYCNDILIKILEKTVVVSYDKRINAGLTGTHYLWCQFLIEDFYMK